MNPIIERCGQYSLKGTVRESLCEDFQPICDINLSLPLESKRLMDLVLGGKIVIRNEKDLNTLKRNLDRALQAKIGRGLQEISTPNILQIHSDTTLCTLREELLAYQQTLDKQLVRATNPKASKKQGKGKKGRKKGQSPESTAKVIAAIEEEKPKIAELIEFLSFLYQCTTNVTGNSDNSTFSADQSDTGASGAEF